MQFRHWWGKEKRAELLASIDKETPYAALHPVLPLGLPFVPLEVRVDYNGWPSVAELLDYPSFGTLTNRDEALVSIDHEPLVKRMERYFDPRFSNEQSRKSRPC